AIRVLFPEVGNPVKPKPLTPLNCEINGTSLYRGVSSIWFLAHVTGWWGKMCMFRDWRFCWVLGIAFELLELIFQFVIPDFQECWWDSLFMDLFGANFIGMCLGHLTLKYLETKKYDWSGNRGVLRRTLSQFTPFSWSRYDWEVFSSFKRFALVAVAVFVCLVVELNAFFLLSTLNIPKESHINKYRLCLIFMLGIPAASEYYEFITNPALWRLGQNAWMMCSIGVFEVLVWVKFAHGLAGSTTPPPDVYLPLLAFGFLFALWMLLFFSKFDPNTSIHGVSGQYKMSQISSGREDDGEEVVWLNEVKAMHKEIVNHELAWPFLEPVDPVKLNIPTYFQIIERPMDLGTINTRLQMATGEDQDEMATVFGPPTAMLTYNSLDEYKQDLLLVFDNAVKFNGDDGRIESVGNMAKRMRQHVLALLAERFSIACLTWEEKVELNLLQKMIHQAKIQKVREHWKKDSFVARWNRQKIETRIESLMQANQ
ncbi:phosphatidylserine synthase, partial [Thraustotheca clavata]